MRPYYAVWFRNDFRIADHEALYHAVKSAKNHDGKWLAFFHLDPKFIENESPFHDYFFQSLDYFREECKKIGIHIHILYGSIDTTFTKFIDQLPNLQAIYYHHDQVGEGFVRDQRANEIFLRKGINIHTYEGGHIHSSDEIKKQDGSAYKVFTPYYRAWSKARKKSVIHTDKKELMQTSLQIDALDEVGENIFVNEILPKSSKTWENFGEDRALYQLETFFDERLISYDDDRNMPIKRGTSQVSPYFTTGALSPRSAYHFAISCLDRAGKGAETFIKELAWRDFYYMIYHFHPTAADEEVNKKYRSIPWQNDARLFELWKTGKTGFPFVDAGMRQLNRCGWMHNRLRMITASFLTKDYLVDWRLGERYFQQQLIDYDPASNIGGWQWAASVGTDAVPYFRIFNPTTQSKRFDPQGDFIRKFIPELKRVPDKYIHEPHSMPVQLQEELRCVIGIDYPAPSVDHATQRKRAIAMFKQNGCSN